MENTELDQLRTTYKATVEEWIAAIRREESLATEDHTIPAVDVWELAGFDEEEVRGRARKARQAYEDAVRKADFHF